MNIAVFISPHGYGHAARASAVMAALHQLNPAIRFDIFTLVPEWFFHNALAGPFRYHPLLTDIGMVQDSALQENIPATRRRLNEFLPFAPDQLAGLAGQLKDLACRLVICDIAPLGIAVARTAGLPSVLIENFTWDWLYQGYLDQDPAMGQFIDYLGDLFQAAEMRVQTEPLCDPQPAALTVPPISRAVRTEPAEIRRRLDLPPEAQVVMVTMGGIAWQYDDLSALEQHPTYYFIVPGAGQAVERRGHLIALPHHSPFFHPDLINASDAVMGKVGYSTIAEVYQAGIPFGYVARPQFRESDFLVAFIENHMPGRPVSAAAFENGSWLAHLPDLLALPRSPRRKINVAEQVAACIAATFL